jgi:DNA polymerase III subunit alpha
VLHAEPLDAAAAKTQKGLRIFLRDTKPLDSIAKRLVAPAAGAAGAGDVALVLRLDLQTEVEFKLEGRYQVSPQIAGAIKAVTGVEMVETL